MTSEFLDQFLVLDSTISPPSASCGPASSVLSPPAVSGSAILPGSVLPSAEESSASESQPSTHLSSLDHDFLGLSDEELLRSLENDPLFVDAGLTENQESIPDAELLKLEGITIHSPQKCRHAGLDEVLACPGTGNPTEVGDVRWDGGMPGTVARLSPKKPENPLPQTAFKPDEGQSKRDLPPPSSAVGDLVEATDSKLLLEHVEFTNGQLEDPFLDSSNDNGTNDLASGASASRAEGESCRDEQATPVTAGNAAIFYAPGFKPFPNLQLHQGHPIPASLAVKKRQQSGTPQHQLEAHSGQWQGQMHYPGLGRMATTTMEAGASPWCPTWAGFDQEQNVHSQNVHLPLGRGINLQAQEWLDPPAHTQGNFWAKGASLNLNMQVANRPGGEMNNFNNQARPALPQHHCYPPPAAPSHEIEGEGLMIQMPQPQRPQAHKLNNLAAVTGHVFFPLPGQPQAPPPPPPPPIQKQIITMLPTATSRQDPQTSPLRAERRRARCPNSRDRYHGLGRSSSSRPPDPSCSSLASPAIDGRRPRRSTSMGTLSASRSLPSPSSSSPPRHTSSSSGCVRKRKSWTRATSSTYGGGAGMSPSSSSSLSSSVHHRKGAGRGRDPFVNFTPQDHETLMSGVAPSGSSKTKARREREAVERRRRIGEVAVKAVRAAGGDVGELVREGLVEAQ